jgi:hypothetical protein
MRRIIAAMAIVAALALSTAAPASATKAQARQVVRIANANYLRAYTWSSLDDWFDATERRFCVGEDSVSPVYAQDLFWDRWDNRVGWTYNQAGRVLFAICEVYYS